MSTTGRSPLIAAPTAPPVKPASEIGVSTTRFVPNSSTNPESTLNGVPASATSSPKIQTRESRRISSASASLTACAKVSSRAPVSGIDILVHFFDIRIWSGDGKLDCLFHFHSPLRRDSIQRSLVGELLVDQPKRQVSYRIAFALPGLFFLLGAIVLTIDVANVVAGVAVGIA